jgi:hypothetical protein
MPPGTVLTVTSSCRRPRLVVQEVKGRKKPLCVYTYTHTSNTKNVCIPRSPKGIQHSKKNSRLLDVTEDGSFIASEASG